MKEEKKAKERKQQKGFIKKTMHYSESGRPEEWLKANYPLLESSPGCSLLSVAPIHLFIYFCLFACVKPSWTVFLEFACLCPSLGQVQAMSLVA